MALVIRHGKPIDKKMTAKQRRALYRKTMFEGLIPQMCYECSFFTYINQKNGEIIQDFCVCNDDDDKKTDNNEQSALMEEFHFATKISQQNLAWKHHKDVFNSLYAESESDSDDDYDPYFCGCQQTYCIDCNDPPEPEELTHECESESEEEESHRDEYGDYNPI
jgi:hypothetical protein